MEPFESPSYLPTLGDLTQPGPSADVPYESVNPLEPSVPGPADPDAKPKGKKRKSDAADGKVKKTRQSQSCDACRARKVRCDRPPPGSAVDPSLPTKDVCSHCRHLGLECRFEYKPKKRGPPNQYLRKLNDEHDTPENDTSDQAPGSAEPSPFAARSFAPSGSRQDHPDTFSPPMPPGGFWFRSDQPAGDRAGDGSGPAEHRTSHSARQEMSGSGYQAEQPPKAVEHQWEPSLMSVLRTAPPHSDLRSQAPDESRSMFTPLAPFNYDPSPRPDPSPLRTHLAVTPSSGSPYPTFPHNPSNPFDVVLPRGLLYVIVDLYFDYLYGLCPYIHRPTFMQDLRGNREEKPDADEWIALVMGLVCSTLVQIPRAFVPLPRSEVKALVDKTYGMVAVYLSKPFRQCTTTRHVLLYMAGMTCTLLGLRPLWAEYFGRSWAMTCQERANEESSYDALPPIERALRRRVFWLGVGGDKSGAVLEGVSPIASETATATVKLPSLVEDEYITHDGELPMPEGRTSILTGFYYISKLFRLTGQVLEKRLHDRLTPPTGILLQMRINEINGLYVEVMSLMDDCPPELRLEGNEDAQSVSNLSDDWDRQASREVRALLLDPQASRTVAKDAFLVQQANIYVTQQMTRYVILQYRDDLLTLQQDELAAQARSGASIGRFSASQRRMDTARALFSDEEKEQVCSDLLAILQKIPIQVIAVNSVSLVSKVRFVASTLLDALHVEGGQNGANGSSARVQRAQTYLWDFLRILTEIEALYSMDDDDAPVPTSV